MDIKRKCLNDECLMTNEVSARRERAGTRLRPVRLLAERAEYIGQQKKPAGGRALCQSAGGLFGWSALFFRSDLRLIPCLAAWCYNGYLDRNQSALLATPRKRDQGSGINHETARKRRKLKVANGKIKNSKPKGCSRRSRRARRQATGRFVLGASQRPAARSWSR